MGVNADYPGKTIELGGGLPERCEKRVHKAEDRSACGYDTLWPEGNCCQTEVPQETWWRGAWTRKKAKER